MIVGIWESSYYPGTFGVVALVSALKADPPFTLIFWIWARWLSVTVLDSLSLLDENFLVEVICIWGCHWIEAALVGPLGLRRPFVAFMAKSFHQHLNMP